MNATLKKLERKIEERHKLANKNLRYWIKEYNLNPCLFVKHCQISWKTTADEMEQLLPKLRKVKK